MELLSFAILAFIMGIKHAFDADHILIVSNFLSRAKKLDETLNISLSWGIGHMLTAGIMTLIILIGITCPFTLTKTLSESWIPVLEDND